jgi:hypothetical protein
MAGTGLVLSSRGQEGLKALAMGLMMASHGLLVLGEPGSVAYELVRGVARVGFPLFGFLVAYNLAVRGTEAGRYTVPLVWRGILTQPFYMYALGVTHLNIFFSICCGVLVIEGIQRGSKGWWLVAIGLVGSLWVSGGVAAVVSIVAMYGVLRGSVGWWFVLVPALLVVNLGHPWMLFALAVVPLVVVVATVGRGWGLRRLPKAFWWWVYPGHLMVLAGARWVL